MEWANPSMKMEWNERIQVGKRVDMCGKKWFYDIIAMHQICINRRGTQ